MGSGAMGRSGSLETGVPAWASSPAVGMFGGVEVMMFAETVILKLTVIGCVDCPACPSPWPRTTEISKVRCSVSGMNVNE
jgi:hypothetical protein